METRQRVTDNLSLIVGILFLINGFSFWD